MAANCDLQQAGRDRGRVPARAARYTSKADPYPQVAGTRKVATSTPHEIVASEMQMLDGRRESGSCATSRRAGRAAPYAARAPVVPVPDSFADDDIPFVWMLAPLAGMLAYATHSAGPLL